MCHNRWKWQLHNKLCHKTWTIYKNDLVDGSFTLTDALEKNIAGIFYSAQYSAFSLQDVSMVAPLEGQNVLYFKFLIANETQLYVQNNQTSRP